MIDILVNPSDWGGGFIVARASGSRLYKTQMPNDFLLGSTIVPAATLCEPKLLLPMEATISRRIRESNA
jgi:hypothetical protein